jgi:hypothetical protein
MTVTVHARVYELSEPLASVNEDSGTADAPIIHRAAAGDEVRLCPVRADGNAPGHDKSTAWGACDGAEICFRIHDAKSPGPTYVVHSFLTGTVDSVTDGGARTESATALGQAVHYAVACGPDASFSNRRNVRVLTSGSPEIETKSRVAGVAAQPVADLGAIKETHHMQESTTTTSANPAPAALLPCGWDPKQAGDSVLAGLIKVTAPEVKGAHDAEFVCVGERAYIVEHDNDIQPGHGAGPAQYCVLSILDLKSLTVERVVPLAKSEQVFDNMTLPKGMCFVPRLIQEDASTLRAYFCSQPAGEQAVTWYRDFDLRTQSFEGAIHKARLKTAAGTFDMLPCHFHADAAAHGFTRPAVGMGLYIFDSFKVFDGRRYVAINNFEGKQNALARLLDDFETFEVIGHYNEPQTEELSESSVNRLPDGTWMAICRNDRGNYHFSTSQDGRTWSVGREMPWVKNGLNSKPTFDRFRGVYYLGWQENTRIQGCNRSVFNVDVSRDGQTWERKYRFETPHSFQYPTFHEHEGVIWLTVTQSDHQGTTDRIMFGRLEGTRP